MLFLNLELNFKEIFLLINLYNSHIIDYYY